MDKNLQCNCCLRSLGISYYAKNVFLDDSDKSNENISEESEEKPTKRQKVCFEIGGFRSLLIKLYVFTFQLHVLSKLDPLFEHRDWCLWVTPGAPETADKENILNEPVLGWKMYLKFIVNHMEKPSDNDVRKLENE